MGSTRVARQLTLAVIVAVLGAASGGPLSTTARTVDAASSTPAPRSSAASPRPSLKVGEQTQMRTRYSTTTYNADHTFSTRVSGHPITYRDKTGHWQLIDSTLTATSVRGYAY